MRRKLTSSVRHVQELHLRFPPPLPSPKVARMKVLIATVTAGGGHLAAASAIEEAWRALRPNDAVEKLDLVKFFSPLHRRIHADGYETLVEHAPEIWGILFSKTDDPKVVAKMTRLQRFFTPTSTLKLERHLKRTKPDVVICTHYAPLEVLDRMAKDTKAHQPFVVSVVTDFEAHAFWMGKSVNLYCVAAEGTSARLIARGALRGNIAATGIPISAKFAQAVDASNIRQRCGLRDDQPVILLLSGGFGWGPISETLAELDKISTPFQTIVVCGRNAELRREIAAQDRKHPTDVLGFVSNMHELMAVSDIVITKPGGLTTSEAMASALPMVVLKPIPGQEAANSDFLLQAGAAIKVNRVEELPHRIEQLLTSKRLVSMRRAAKAIGKPAAARNVCEEVIRRIG
jgi:processive 1,2-diacylglycerol beta-glucosyltransferase